MHAWRILAMLATLASLVEAARYIETSALLPCIQSSQFSATKFDVHYNADNKTASIDAQLVSAIDGNFTVKLDVIVYGISIIELDITGCDLSQTVCPISPGKFDVETSVKIPDKYANEVPGIAYTFPDIDAVVRAKVYYVNSAGKIEGDEIACVEAQLSNGKTVKHSYVSWILFGIIALGVTVAAIATLMHRISTAGHIIGNVVSLFSYFQSMAAMAMMAVHRMPPIASAWAQNFEWTMGITSVKFMQDAITWYVRSTGGKPTTVLANKDLISIAVYKRSLQEREMLAPGLFKRLDFSSNSTTTNERDITLDKTLVLQGIKRVSYLANIELTNFFATGAAFFIFVGIFLVAALALVKGILELSILCGAVSAHRFDSYRIQWRSYTKGVMFRYFLIGFTQLSVLSLWEFTDRVSPATVVDAVVIYTVLLVCLSFALIKVWQLARKSKSVFQNPAYILYGNPDVLNRWGFLYVQFRADAYWFLLPLLLYSFICSAVIALGQSAGKVQAVIILVVNVVYFILLCVVRPYLNKKTNGFNIAVAAVQFVNSIFFLFFSQIFGEKVDVAASIMGIVYFVVNAVFSLVLLIMIIFACAWAILHPDPENRYEPVKDDRNLFIADDPGEKLEPTELDALGDTARAGWRESYMNYHDGQNNMSSGEYDTPQVAGASATHLGGHSDSVSQAAQRETLSGYDGEEEWPTYRDFQSSGILGGQLYHDRVNERLVDHEDSTPHSRESSMYSDYPRR